MSVVKFIGYFLILLPISSLYSKELLRSDEIFPSEVLFHLFLQCSPKELISLRGSCSQFKDIIKDSLFLETFSRKNNLKDFLMESLKVNQQSKYSYLGALRLMVALQKAKEYKKKIF